MITFSLAELKNIEESIRKLVAVNLPIVYSFRLSKAVKQLNNEIVALEDQRLLLVRKYGTEQEDGSIKVPDEIIPAFLEEYNQLLKEEVQLDFTPINIDALKGVELSPIDMVALEKFFTDE